MDNVISISKDIDTQYKDSNLLFAIMEDATLSNKEVTKQGVLKVKALIVKGIGKGYAFNPERLNPYRKKVMSVIGKMKEQFFRGDDGNQNGGAVVLLKQTEDKIFWTKSDVDIEHLICLSIGLGLGDFCQKREEWGHMPYFVFHVSREECLKAQ